MNITENIRRSSELHNPEIYRRANAIGNTKRSLYYVRKKQNEVSIKLSVSYGLIASSLRERLNFLRNGYLERGLLDDIFNEHGDISRE